MAGPNPIRVALSTLRALRVDAPSTTGTGTADHSLFGPVLESLTRGIDAVDRDSLRAYLDHVGAVDPTGLSRDESLAYWLNLYNALAIDLVLDGRAQNVDSVLEVRAAFDRTVAVVGGEQLSMIDIEHGKIRRYKDPRIHGSLVCGSLSCPTVPADPFVGASVSDQLDDQMRTFVGRGGAVIDRSSGSVYLSRVFLWYGADFARPQRMPTFIPASRRSVLAALLPWLDPDDAAWISESEPRVEFQRYDWGIGCAVS